MIALGIKSGSFVDESEKNVSERRTYAATGEHLLGSIHESTASGTSFTFWGLDDGTDFSLYFSGIGRNHSRLDIFAMAKTSCSKFRVRPSSKTLISG